MANYNKSFNFRNGVQVDNDNFIVNANGLVGIGTTVPESYLLNVYGDTRVTGLITASQLNVGVATVGFLTASNIRVSGVVTAASFSGSAAGLTGIYAIAVDGWYVSAGNISTTSKVGIGTTLPTGNFQVGVGVTINNNGNATYAGIITASSFDGIGSNITQINASNISSGTLNNARLPSNINVGGIVTATSFSGSGANITTINADNISSGTLNNARLPSNINVGGIVTATSFSGSGANITTINADNISSGTLNNARLPSNINVGGIVTATTFVGNLTGTATTASSLSGNPNISVANINSSGIITATTLGISGLTTTTNLVSQTSIGIGTNSPIGDFQIKNATTASILVTSSAQSSVISIGRSNSLEDSNGVLRFGNTSGLFPYSNGTSLDIINYSTGNLNFYLEAGTPGIGTGNFYWHRRKNFARLMTLTYDGNLGIAITNPVNTLHVVGTSTVTSNAYFGNNVEIVGNLNIDGFLFVDTISTNVTGNLSGNVNASTGISTFNDIKVSSKVLCDSFVGIGITNPNNPLEINSLPTSKFIVNSQGSVGVKTSSITNGIGFDALNASAIFGSVGVGTTSLRSIVDFSDAGKELTGASANKMYMYPPRVTTTQRNNLTGMLGGAMVYNITLNRLEYFDSSTSGWKFISGTAV